MGRTRYSHMEVVWFMLWEIGSLILEVFGEWIFKGIGHLFTRRHKQRQRYEALARQRAA